MLHKEAWSCHPVSYTHLESADEAIDAVVVPAQHQRYVEALSSLFSSEILSGR